MARLIAGSQSLLLLPLLQRHATESGSRVIPVGFSVSSGYKLHLSSTAESGTFHLTLTSSALSEHISRESRLNRGISVATVSSASSFNIESPREVVEIKPDTTSRGGDDGIGRERNGGGGGGGGGGDGGDNGGGKGDEGSDDADAKMNKALLMSQKFTLAYAALVGLGGLMGYLNGGSQKCLASGGLSAMLLYYVYSELPKRPVFASAVGLGLSTALLVVMGSRFKKSGKIFPAGVVSLVSLIMTGGYVHGIIKTSH